MRSSFFILIYLLAANCVAQNSVKDAFKIIGTQISNYQFHELIATDSIYNDDIGYLMVKSDQLGDGILPFEAVLIDNNNMTGLLVMTALFWDEQCHWYNTTFLEIDWIGQSFKKIEPIGILPEISIMDLLKSSRVPKIMEKYLATLKAEYLGEDATIDNVLEELYDFYYDINPTKRCLEVSLSVCDYIPTNVMEISEKDWAKVETDFKNIQLTYNKTARKFVLPD